jgi:tRNA-specific adenosine deaminase 1
MNIQQEVVKTFEQFASKESKFTVLAGIVKEQNEAFACVAFGTGTKVLPDKGIDSQGFLLKDSHAEVICRRNFKRYLLLRAEELFDVECTPWKLKTGIRFHFYVSQAPCGDASMVQLDLEQSVGQRLENERKRRKFQHEDSKEMPSRGSTLLRGRLDYAELGRLRTKPGRIDSPLSSCMSCSDKMALWNYVGWQGGLLSLFMEPVWMDQLVIGDYFDEYHLKRSLCDRTDGHQPRISSCSPFRLSKSKGATKAASISLSWNQADGLETIVQGKRQGASAINFKSASKISKAKMAILIWGKRDFAKGLTTGISYHQAKLLATEYQAKKDKLLAEKFQDWLRSKPCTIPIDTFAN